MSIHHPIISVTGSSGAGTTSGSGGVVLAAPGIGIDPWGATVNTLDAIGGSAVGWLEPVSPGVQSTVDVTGVVANGTLTLVIMPGEAGRLRSEAAP